MMNTILCMLAMTELYPAGASQGYTDKVKKTHADRLGVCIEVAHKAEEKGLKPSLVVALAYEESRFDDTQISSSGAVGALQVLPKYFQCKKPDCDVVYEGIRILKYWMKRYPKYYLCHYNAGNKCNKASRGYAERIKRRQHRLFSQLDAVSYDFER